MGDCGTPEQSGQSGETTAQTMAANKIYEVMFGAAFDKSNWQTLEQYASGKAREMRSERLKRNTSDAAAPTQTDVNIPQRRILTIKRRKQ